MSRTKISYGRRKRTEEDLDILISKKPENQIFDAAIQDFDSDHQRYMSELLKLTKAPIKQSLSSNIRSKYKEEERIYEQPLKYTEPKNQKVSSNRTQRQFSEMYADNKKKFIKEERPKFFSGYRPPSQKYEPLKATPKSQLTHKLLKDLQIRRSQEKTIPSRLVSQRPPCEQDQQNNNQSFLECISEYISQLSSNNQIKSTQMDSIIQQNKKLRKKLAIYEERFKQTKLTIEQHLKYNLLETQISHQKTKERQYKHKIKQLTKALSEAVDKANEQKEQIQYFQGFLTNFTHQARAYKNKKINKQKLNGFIKDEIDDYDKFKEVLLRTLHSDDSKLKSNLGFRDQARDDEDLETPYGYHQASQDRLAQLLNLKNDLPVSRSKPSRSLSRGEAPQPTPKETKRIYRRNTETAYTNKFFRQQESETDE